REATERGELAEGGRRSFARGGKLRGAGRGRRRRGAAEARRGERHGPGRRRRGRLRRAERVDLRARQLLEHLRALEPEHGEQEHAEDAREDLLALGLRLEVDLLSHSELRQRSLRSGPASSWCSLPASSPWPPR